MSVAIRRMTMGDIHRVAALEQGIYDPGWSAKVFCEELGLDDRRYFVVEQAEVVVAYGGLLHVDDGAHITTLAVDPAARRGHLGTRLMITMVDAALEEGVRDLTLEVRKSNAGAQRFYEKFGFASVGLRDSYYQDEDALVMWAIDIDSQSYRSRLDAIRHGLKGSL